MGPDTGPQEAPAHRVQVNGFFIASDAAATPLWPKHTAGGYRDK